jgi:acyl-coenzyme A thioesterase PaaI-like protein
MVTTTTTTTDPGYFLSIPWCATLLSDPFYKPVPSRIGRPTPDKRGEFFTRTLATSDTITACMYQTRQSQSASSSSSSPLQSQSLVVPSSAVVGGGNDTSELKSVSVRGTGKVEQVRCFLATRSGVNGFPGIAHGGFVAAVIDEVMGYLINANLTAARTEVGAGADHAAAAKGQGQAASPAAVVPMTGTGESTAPMSSVMTAELTIKYRRPVPTGEVLLVRAWIDKMEGRKIVVRAAVEDQDGQVLSEGLALFIALRPGVGGPKVKRKMTGENGARL